ncbi:MAG: hypothetical protein KGR98_04155 [Verrucomicrobia bacterium]|nr:hypothetical protein [Verrucomicrobiota bacterium]MDE3099742.1 hypothetical protein [Verrucomicrobiota bacterium]
MNTGLLEFAGRLRGLISNPRAAIGHQQFQDLALALFTLQFHHNPAYRGICEQRCLVPGAVRRWTDVPFVPAAAFKELRLTSLAPGERTAVFHSSGTTAQTPSRHLHCPASLALYESSLWTWFAHNVPISASAGPQSLVLLAPPPSQAPHSSLVHMFETLRRNLAAPPSAFVGLADSLGAWTLDFSAALSALQASSPFLVLGTAFSFVHLLDFLAAKKLRLKLPAGSRVMETGGYKNRSRSLPKAELHALITESLGIPPENIIREYGMCEASSQAYASFGTPFRFPPWARVRVISPETGAGANEGQPGLLQLFDLANVFSVAAIQTEDLAVRRANGFEWIGRAQAAPPRGCSLMSPSSHTPAPRPQ